MFIKSLTHWIPSIPISLHSTLFNYRVLIHRITTTSRVSLLIQYFCMASNHFNITHSLPPLHLMSIPYNSDHFWSFPHHITHSALLYKHIEYKYITLSLFSNSFIYNLFNTPLWMQPLKICSPYGFLKDLVLNVSFSYAHFFFLKQKHWVLFVLLYDICFWLRFIVWEWWLCL